MNTKIEQAAAQLENSERGQITCKLLADFLQSKPVRGLDQFNNEAVTTLVAHYTLGSGADACAVIDALYGVIERNPWVNQDTKK
jgi:hypothetical protein